MTQNLRGKIADLAAAFERGNALTAKQISGYFDIASPGSTVSKLRAKGYCIYLNKNGKYRLGTPTKRMIAHLASATGCYHFYRK